MLVDFIVTICEEFLELIRKIPLLYRSSEYDSIAYVTFRDAYALETALLLNVRIIVLSSCFLILSLLDSMDRHNNI